MNKHLPTCFKFGLAGNIFFVLFGIICMIYYAAFGDTNVIILPIEFAAYTCEVLGFIFIILTFVWFSRYLRHRLIMKISFSFYILMELVLMVIELNSYKFEFYEPYSVVLAIVHSIISAAVCFSFLSLDPTRVKFEMVIIATCAFILVGMICGIINIRIYFGIIINALAYIFLFASIIYMLNHEMLDIDCKGDKAKVSEYRSTFFD